MKKIKFKTVNSQFHIPNPAPASKHIPEWYRSMDRIADREQTIKTCIPFLDSISAGYMITLAADVYFENGVCQQISKIEVVHAHKEEQISELAHSKEYFNKPYKWINSFIIETPKGYSSFITHPLNRIDLPFYTLSGVVDTDTFPAPINFPFFVKENFTGIIREGTPIAQVIPFKRDDWKSDVEDKEDAEIPLSFTNNVFNPPFGFYKKKFWKRKKYQ